MKIKKASFIFLNIFMPVARHWCTINLYVELLIFCKTRRIKKNHETEKSREIAIKLKSKRLLVKIFTLFPVFT